MTRRFMPQTLGLLAAVFCLIVACLQAAEPIAGTGVNPLTRINLGDSISFAIAVKPKTDKLHWELSQTRKDGNTKISSGYEIGPNEKFVYAWEPEAKTMWIATAKFVEKTVLLDGLSKTTGGIYNTSAYADIPGIPETFKKAVAGLLDSK